jgi:hypothetical protein
MQSAGRNRRRNVWMLMNNDLVMIGIWLRLCLIFMHAIWKFHNGNRLMTRNVEGEEEVGCYQDTEPSKRKTSHIHAEQRNNWKERSHVANELQYFIFVYCFPASAAWYLVMALDHPAITFNPTPITFNPLLRPRKRRKITFHIVSVLMRFALVKSCYRVLEWNEQPGRSWASRPSWDEFIFAF